MFRNYAFQRATSSIVLVAFTTLTLSPLAHARAVETGLAPQTSSAALPALTSEDRYAQVLAAIDDDLKAAAPQSAFGRLVPPGAKNAYKRADPARMAASLRARSAQLQPLYADIEAGFASTGEHLRDAGLAPEILNRHNDALAQFRARKAEFERLMDAVAQAPDASAAQQAALAALGEFSARYPNRKPHQYGNPDRLPFGMGNGKVRAPNVTRAQFQASLFPPTYDKVMLAGPIPDGLQFTPSALSPTPDAGDLAATDEVQLTQAVRDQAAALHKNPVTIYNWVRNNIAFIPSYGSIQGSEATLRQRRGNAFDTASLLIALYRASGIPARYVYGTIEVPAAQAMNWVGGVSRPEAAQALLGQGGIPNIGMLSAGAIGAIRMEHVWVQAYVDYMPSRGAVNRTPDAWVSMDASFKQFTYAQGMDLKNNVPVPSQALLDQLQQGASVNPADGSVQNLNLSGLPSALTQYQGQVKTYIDSQKANATVQDVIGGQQVVAQGSSVLQGSLPYKTVAVAAAFQSMPDNLRWKFKTSVFGADGFSDADNPFIELNKNTAQLAGKKITLSFVPATAADQSLIGSYLPKPHADGTPVLASEYPHSLPGYLLQMKAELRVDGEVVALSGQSFGMGSDVMLGSRYFNPSTGTWNGGADIDITVGEYNAIGLDLQGSLPGKQAELAARIAATKNKLTQYQQNPADPSVIAGITKEDISGDLTHALILSYFSQIDTNDDVLAHTANDVVNYRLPSYGRAFFAAQPSYYFGIVRNVSFPGVGLDVSYVFNHLTAKDGNPDKSRQFLRQSGAAGSATEHVVPERLFGNPALAAGDPRQAVGISAVRILAAAAAAGQKIYTLTAANQAVHASVLQGLQISQDAKAEISDALASGKEVTVHAQDVSINGWSGSGYLLIDPDSGAGAYKIAGGTNGGFLKWVDSNSALLGLAAWAIGLAGGFWFALAIAMVITIVLAGIIMYMEESDGSCGNGGLALYTALEILFGVLGAFAEPLYGWIYWLLGFQADGGIRAALTHCNR